ncbi:ESSS subunit of NADH:ubiquinone oxidoreductase-domain-containing protein [Hyaloraphidium curvatum]|nr:ESSS subunit of NADH:ubiquinone oxidoreductase-domain-containing protein [Hyaloraphidium curvatum]
MLLARARLLPRRLFHSSSVRRAGHGDEPFYEPGGYLFNEKPLPPGQKRKWEWWEAPIYTGFVGGVVVFAYLYSKKPDHKPTVWARVEAERRLEERGETFGWPFPPNYRKDKAVQGREYPQS